MSLINKRWDPSNWVGLKLFGRGEQRPNNYHEIWRTLIENRDALPYAWRILKTGVCDGCALGTSGMKDWTVPGTHLCNVRLRLLRLNTMPALDTEKLADVSGLKTMDSAKLRDLGRLPCPFVRRRGERGFKPVKWDEALALIADRIQASTPERLGFYLTSRGLCNESYYVAQKAVRAMGSNNIDNAARICHSPSTTALKMTIGAGASTCSYTDWLESDLLVFIGSNVANNQPVATKYIHYAKKNGAKVAVVNNYAEPGMARYWIPSITESALFGTKIADRFFLINIGSDVAFLNGVLKHMLEYDWLDASFVEQKTVNLEDVRAGLDAQTWEELERVSGATRHDMYDLARMFHEADKAVLVWSMGITQHQNGVDNVRAIVNLALTKGYVGRRGCGLMPIRGHSGVQGGAEMGAYSTAFPGGVPISEGAAGVLSEKWGFDVPTVKGLTAPEMIDAAHDGELDVLFSVGGNFLEVLPDPDYVREAMEKIPLKVFMDIVVSSQMLLDPGETVVLLPAATRYETPGGVTETTTERRVVFSPEVPGRRIDQARPEWEVFEDLARRVRADISQLLCFQGTQEIRSEIARVVPFYNGIQDLKQAGDQFQYGGAHLCEGWNFKTPDKKAHFSRLELPANDLPEGSFRMATRRGKQFNSMVHEATDGLTGALRDAVLMSRDDAQRLRLENGDAIVLRNSMGSFHGHVFLAPITPGNLQVHWPEGNVLINRSRRAHNAGVPDFNAVVEVERAGGAALPARSAE